MAVKKDEYGLKIREGIRVALQRRGYDPDDQRALVRASKDAELNSRFLEQFLDWTVASPRSDSMRKIMELLKVTEADLLDPIRLRQRRKSVLKETEIYHVSNDDVAESRVCEYDVRATSQVGSSDALITITEKPVLAERSIRKSLVARMHPSAEPAIIRITGDAMCPLYKDGAVLLVDAGVRFPSPAGVYVLWDGASHIVQRCQVVLGSNPIAVKVSSDNSGYEPQIVPASTLHVAGQVFCELDQEDWTEKTA